MQKLCKNLLFILLAAFSFVMLSTQAMAANFNNLSFMANYQENHPTAIEVYLPFIKQVEKDLDGKVSFNYFGNNALYPESESYAVLNDGRVDFGVIRPSLFPGIVNYITVTDIPGISPNSIIGTLVGHEVIEKFPQVAAELPKESVHFFLWSSTSYQIHTINPVKNLEELKGKKIIAWDAITRDIVIRLGANPIRLTPTDSYLSLSKGMADGVLAPLAPMRSFKIAEVAPHHLIVNASVGTFSMSIFKPLWDEFPPEIQAYFKEHGGAQLGLKAAQSLENAAAIDTKWMQDLGHNFYYLDEAGKADLQAKLATAEEVWLEAMPDRALAEEILAFAKERAAFHIEELNKGTYGDYTLE